MINIFAYIVMILSIIGCVSYIVGMFNGETVNKRITKFISLLIGVMEIYICYYILFIK